jgi:hypothetical protein
MKKTSRSTTTSGNLIAIGPTKSGKTTAINNLLLNPCFGNLALYDNIIYISKHCSDLRHLIGFTATSSSARCLKQGHLASTSFAPPPDGLL